MGGAIYPRIIGRDNQNHQPILHILYGVPKFLVVFDGGGGVQYILGILVGGARNSTVMRGASFPEGGSIFLGKIAWGCQISWGAKFPVTGSDFRGDRICCDTGFQYSLPSHPQHSWLSAHHH